MGVFLVAGQLPPPVRSALVPWWPLWLAAVGGAMAVLCRRALRSPGARGAVMESFTPMSSLLGGALIGLAASALLWLDGKVAGISGIVGGLLRREDVGWRGAFVAGVVAGGVILRFALPSAFTITVAEPLPLILAAGLLVGFGTQLGNGCTSGHGICGVSRGLPRSLVATATFMATGALTVLVVRHVVGVLP